MGDKLWHNFQILNKLSINRKFFIIRIDPLLRLTSREDSRGDYGHTTCSTKINQQTWFNISLGLYTGISHEHLFRKKHLFRKRKRIISKKVHIFWDQKQARESRTINVTLSLKLIGYMCLKCHRTFKSILLQPIKSQWKQYSFNLKNMRRIVCVLKILSHELKHRLRLLKENSKVHVTEKVPSSLPIYNKNISST